MSNEPKKYVPKSNAKKVQFAAGGSIIKCSFDAKELAEFVRQNQNSNGWITLVIAERREPTEKATHSIYLDTWQPNQNGARPAQTSRPATPPPEASDDTVPF